MLLQDKFHGLGRFVCIKKLPKMSEIAFARLELFGVRKAGGEAGLGVLGAVGAMGMLLGGRLGVTALFCA